ncbi:hypothetical protein [Hoeflea sp. TYP-13]|uniref:hypothetical protein n=1 Tax=Hoeflea sp. TYP-13 TaxID=3230023 RepID=UPI0034C5E965
MNRNLPVISLTAAGLAVLLCTTMAAAQEGRFVMERTDSGFIRLDSYTGEISVCTDTDGQIVCRMAADERHALEEQIDLLEDRIAEMEKVIDGQTSERQNHLPTDEEIDRTFGIMEKMMRRFLGVIEEFDRENEENTPSEPKPEKTNTN